MQESITLSLEIEHTLSETQVSFTNTPDPLWEREVLGGTIKNEKGKKMAQDGLRLFAIFSKRVPSRMSMKTELKGGVQNGTRYNYSTILTNRENYSQ